MEILNDFAAGLPNLYSPWRQIYHELLNEPGKVGTGAAKLLMNWARLRHVPWLDTRARFVARTPRNAALLDLGSSDGETLRHFAELRPDLRLFSADIAGKPENYPRGCTFHRADLECDALPWPDTSMAAITCMHVVEHMKSLAHLMKEVKRLLLPCGLVYLETPHPKTTGLPSLRDQRGVTFTMNFFDDPTHIKPVLVDDLVRLAREQGLEIVSTGISRNWLFAASHLWYQFMPPSRQKYTARVHWIGWSAYLIAQRPE